MGGKRNIVRTFPSALVLVLMLQSLAARASTGPLQSLSVSVGGGGDQPLVLSGSDARQQIIVTGNYAGDSARDLTRRVRYQVAPPGIVEVNESGLISAIADGSATIVARSDEDEGASTSLHVRVEHVGHDTPIHFPNQIVPIFTKLGCNGGGCHGKLSGQNGFKLSLLGFEPAEDYEHLVKEARGRRIFPAAPQRSLLLLKATATVPHGGGKRLESESDDYRLLVRWIAQGMPYGSADAPAVARIELFPDRRIMSRGADQQLLVAARYTDGSTQDVTRQALYEPNDHDVASVDGGGLVKMLDQPGDVGIMVRYQGKVAVFRGTVPLGAPVKDLPPARNFIDELVFSKLREMGMPPSAACNDATFIRRVTIDVAGRLPTPQETRQFLANADPGKRDRLIDRLLGSDDYAEYFANKWSALLRNKRTQPAFARGTFEFHDWVRDSLAQNKPYDRLVRDILTASGSVETDPPVAWYRQVRDPKAELEDTAQLFLGMRLQCAQCHHHPFERWSQQDYYSFSAFFSRVARKPGMHKGEEIVFFRRGDASATNAKTKQPVKPAALGEPPRDIAPDEDPRVALADWITAKNNPYFAKSLVNRYWKHFFSRGIVEPEDDLRETNPPTNPQLLDALARHFVDSGYDLKDLVRTICRSTTYQLDATPNEYNRIDKQNFSRYYPKRLTAETLLDAVNGLTGSQSQFAGLPAGMRAMDLPDNSFNASSYFLSVFGRPDSSSSCECERSQQPTLAQSLHLLNAHEVQEKLTASDGRAARLADDSGRSDDAKLAELYLLAYSRLPDTDELSAAKQYIDRLTSVGDAPARAVNRRHAYEDLIWTLINTKEFSFNH